MEVERVPGYDDVYAYIDSQFLDTPEEAPLQSPPAAKRQAPVRGRLPLGGPGAPAAGVVYSPLGGPPPPVPAEETQQRAAPAQQPTVEVGEAVEPPKADAAVPIADAALQAAREVSPASKRRRAKGGEAVQLRIPNIEDYLPGLVTETRPSRPEAKAVVSMEVGNRQRTQQHSPPKPPRKLKRPELSGPRPRKRSKTEPTKPSPSVPEELRSLVGLGNDALLDKYYQRSRGESKEQILSRITNPELSLEEAAKLLGVCPATVRRYTNKGWLRHHRTKGNQRRFRLSDIAEFVREFRAKLE